MELKCAGANLRLDNSQCYLKPNSNNRFADVTVQSGALEKSFDVVDSSTEVDVMARNVPFSVSAPALNPPKPIHHPSTLVTETISVLDDAMA